MGSLPVRIERLVLTCRIHTPAWNTRDTRAIMKSGVIEDLHTLYHHLSIHAKPSKEDVGSHLFTIRLSFLHCGHMEVLCDDTNRANSNQISDVVMKATNTERQLQLCSRYRGLNSRPGGSQRSYP